MKKCAPSTNIRQCNWAKPLTIQQYAIPMILRDRDLMGCAQKDFGKTVAFIIPIIQRLIEEDFKAYPIQSDEKIEPECLILAPTREIALQIDRETKKLIGDIDLKSHTLIGGHATKSQRFKFRSGCNILIATPGRLKDWIERDAVSLDSVQFLVLDEADRIFDGRFERELKFFTQKLPDKEDRQTCIFASSFTTGFNTIVSI